MIALSIADTMLTNTTVIAKDERIKCASIFPYFNKSGQVKQLMIVLPDSKTVFLIPLKKGLASVSFFGVIRLSIDLAELKSHSNFPLLQVSHLYHYDPNWLLSHERFSNYRAQELIRLSNCANYLGNKVRQLLFSRDLSLLEGFVMKSGYLNHLRTIEPEMLLGPIPPTQPKKSDLYIEPVNSGWQLNPIWNAWPKFGLVATKVRKLS